MIVLKSIDATSIKTIKLLLDYGANVNDTDTINLSKEEKKVILSYTNQE
jgi:hypothetical protein